ncbi:MAG: hypothetical protein ACKO04_06675 [Actinomycetes bacterium]
MTRHRIPVPPAPSDLHPGPPPGQPHAPLLLRAAERLSDAGGDGPTLVGCTFVDGGVDLCATLLPHDPRCVAAGMFGFSAPSHWAGAAVLCGGSARPAGPPGAPGDDLSGQHPAERHVEHREAVAVIVVDRGGTTASSVRIGNGDPYDPGPPTGLLVDALHRALGLPSPGSAPPTEALVLGLWVDRLVTLAAGGHVPTWKEAALVHPGVPSHGTVGASAETVAHASTEALEGQDWAAIRRQCAAGGYRGAELGRTEAGWMDDTMFARWMLSAVPDLPPACALLRALGAGEVADGVETVAALLEVELPTGPTGHGSAYWADHADGSGGRPADGR